jgi:cytochrome oxidase assembly protein ShyY1
MTDPSSPGILAWLETLSLSDWLTMLHAMALAFPQLHRSHDWKARIATVRAALRPTAEALGDILKEASRRSELLKAEFAGVMAQTPQGRD